jgi:hypothetical protein
LARYRAISGRISGRSAGGGERVAGVGVDENSADHDHRHQQDRGEEPDIVAAVEIVWLGIGAPSYCLLLNPANPRRQVAVPAKPLAKRRAPGT